MADEVETQASEDAAASAGSTGMNASEEAVAWALGHFGGDLGLVESLRPETRDGIRERLDSLPDDDSDRLMELEAWRERARMGDRVESRVNFADTDGSDGDARWRHRVRVLCDHGPEPGPGPSVRAQLAVVRSMVGAAAALEWPTDGVPADPLGLVFLDRMEPEGLTRALAAVGIWQIAGIVAGQGRRRAARVRSKLPPEWSDTFQAGLSGNGDLAIDAATRLQEVYLGLRRRDFDFDQTAVRLGLFALASAAGGRFERRWEFWLRRAPEQIARLARQLSGINRRGTGLRIGPAFRRSLASFWEHWRAESGIEDGDDE